MAKMPELYDLWARYDDEKERELAKLPVCVDCDQPIQDDYYYLINDKCICPDCLESGYRKDVENYAG